MILSSGVSICGVSACITAARVAGGDDRKLSYIVSLVLIIVVPMIYLMPWLAHLILPHLFAPEVAREVAGAWIGGTIDTTSGVVASSEMVGTVASSHAVIIKAAQNVLIGVVAFFIALYLSTRGERGGQAPSLGIVWEKFPKFILGFVAASLVFSLLQSSGVFVPTAAGKARRDGRREDPFDALLLAGLRLHRPRHASEGDRLAREPQHPALVPHGPGLQHRRDVRDRLAALRRAEADVVVTAPASTNHQKADPSGSAFFSCRNLPKPFPGAFTGPFPGAFTGPFPGAFPKPFPGPFPGAFPKSRAAPVPGPLRSANPLRPDACPRKK